jgi:hypothetical protein
MAFIILPLRHHLEERMSRKLSLATVALSAILLAVPAVAQQPTTKDTTKTAATTGKHHTKRHKKAATAPADTTKKQ